MLRKQYFFWIILALPCLLIVYGYFIEPDRIRVEQVQIHDTDLHQVWGDVKIAQLSDLHIDQIGTREKKVLQKLADIKPDLIVITGDIAQWNADPRQGMQFLESLQAPMGVFGILGDADISTGRRYCLFCHTGGDVHHLRQHPRMLKNSAVKINVPATGRKVTIAGVFHAEDDHADLTAIAELVQQTTEPVLLLDHYAQGWQDIRNKGPLLWLAGDTHGGQIDIPDFIWRDLHLVDYPQYMAGLFSLPGHKWLYVNRGIGTVSYFPFRIGVPPEIAIITFTDR